MKSIKLDKPRYMGFLGRFPRYLHDFIAETFRFCHLPIVIREFPSKNLGSKRCITERNVFRPQLRDYIGKCYQVDYSKQTLPQNIFK